jgi:hypothetical protein
MEDTMRTSNETALVITNAGIAPLAENAAEIVLPHLRGGCVTVGNVVHTLFRLTAPPRRTLTSQA